MNKLLDISLRDMCISSAGGDPSQIGELLPSTSCLSVCPGVHACVRVCMRACMSVCVCDRDYCMKL